MHIFPAIDLIDGSAVRLVKGDYNQKTVYSNSPTDVAKSFEAAGARYLHAVDLQGALVGENGGKTKNFDTIADICSAVELKVEVGGGIRNEQVIENFLNVGVWRVILGTAAVENPQFLRDSVKRFGNRIAVGVDIKDGYVATHGWTKASALTCDDFVRQLCEIGVDTIICTDISKDGMLSGTNLELYRSLNDRFDINITASGGVSTLDDVAALKNMNMYGAILGKALYTGGIDLKSAVELAAE